MRRSVLIFALVAMVMPCMAQQLNYSISGTCADEGKKVYLVDNLAGNAIDSMAVADGKFAFSGSAAKDALLTVKVENRKWETDFFNDGTPVVINVNDSTLTGSPLNERLTKLEIEQNIPMKAFGAKVSNMTREEMLAHQEELADEMNVAIAEMIAFADKVFKEERNSLIPVAFAGYYFMENGVEAYDELVKEQVAFASHPYLKKTRDGLYRSAVHRFGDGRP